MNTKPKDLKRELFIRHYLEHHNITRAYEQAGFASNDANANRYFHRQDVQEAIGKYVECSLKKLDINIHKTLKHLAAIAYGNPLEVMEYDESGWKFKALHQLPPWVAVTLRKVTCTEKSTTYSFEPKVPALLALLKYLRHTVNANKKYKVVVRI